MEKTQQMTINNKLLYVLALIIIFMLGYLIFKDAINSYFRKNDILHHAKITNIPQLYLSCINDNAESVDCQNYLLEYAPKIKVWDEMIKTKKDVNCSDFSSSRDAWGFFDYTGGEAVQYAMQLGITDYKNIGKMYLNYKLKCEYDPYGLDTNHDCWPCKSFNY